MQNTTERQVNAMVIIAADVYCALEGTIKGKVNERYDRNDDIRSNPDSDTVDVQFDGQWYRIRIEPVDEPIPPVDDDF